MESGVAFPCIERMFDFFAVFPTPRVAIVLAQCARIVIAKHRVTDRRSRDPTLLA
jgi:hypothetical protein